MELRQVEHFIAVAEERSFTKAAFRCHIVQSGLSASVRSLEVELKAQLFVRGARSLSLTREGEAFLGEAYRVVGAVRAGVQAVGAVQGLQSGTLFVGAAKILPPPFDLAELLAEFHGEYPAVKLRLRQSSSTSLFRALRDRVLDVVVAGALLGKNTPDNTELLASSPMMLVCAKTHPLAREKEIRLEQLAEENFVDMSREWSSRQITEAAFQRMGMARQVSFEVNDPNCLLALVERSLGVAIVPKMLSRVKSKTSFIPITPSLPDWQLVAALPDHGAPSVAARAFLDLVKASAERDREKYGC